MEETTTKSVEVEDVWGEDDKYPVKDWQYEVACDYTRQGYWEWVASKKENDEDKNDL